MYTLLSINRSLTMLILFIYCEYRVNGILIKQNYFSPERFDRKITKKLPLITCFKLYLLNINMLEGLRLRYKIYL